MNFLGKLVKLAWWAQCVNVGRSLLTPHTSERLQCDYYPWIVVRSSGGYEMILSDTGCVLRYIGDNIMIRTLQLSNGAVVEISDVVIHAEALTDELSFSLDWVYPIEG